MKKEINCSLNSSIKNFAQSVQTANFLRQPRPRERDMLYAFLSPHKTIRHRNLNL